MKPSLSLVLFCVAVLFQAISYPVNRTTAQTPPAVNAANADQGTATPQSDRSITIPGPLRSFLRMAGLSQAVTAPEVLPVLAHTVVLQGYQLGRPTEFLILVRRYVRQAKELDSLGAEPDDHDPWLQRLGVSAAHIGLSGTRRVWPQRYDVGHRRSGKSFSNH